MVYTVGTETERECKRFREIKTEKIELMLKNERKRERKTLFESAEYVCLI